MRIEGLSWWKVPVGNDFAVSRNVSIYLGLCSGDHLVTQVENNWITGTKTLVFDADSLLLAPDSTRWITISLDSAFDYSGRENLLIEIVHDPGSTGLFVSGWNGGSARSVQAHGGLSPYIPQMMLHASPMAE